MDEQQPFGAAIDALFASSPLVDFATGEPLAFADDVQRLWDTERERWRAALLQAVAKATDGPVFQNMDPAERESVRAAYAEEIDAALVELSDFFARRNVIPFPTKRADQ